MILVDANVVIRSYEAAGALLPPQPPVRRRDPPADPLRQIDDTWRTLLATGKVGTVTEVLCELKQKRAQPSARWLQIVENDFHNRIVQPADKYYEFLKEIHEFVKRSWSEHHADAFLKGADAHLIAMAAARGWAVATLEAPAVPQLDRGATKFSSAIKIPYVAWRFGVPTKTIYDLFKAPGRR